MYCSNCGTKLADNAKFCSNCGTPVQQTTSQPASSSAAIDPQAVRTPSKSETARNAAKKAELFFTESRWIVAKDRNALRVVESDLETFLLDGLEGLLANCSVLNESERNQILEVSEVRTQLERTLVKVMLVNVVIGKKKVDERTIYVLSDRLGVDALKQIMAQVSAISSVMKR